MITLLQIAFGAAILVVLCMVIRNLRDSVKASRRLSNEYSDMLERQVAVKEALDTGEQAAELLRENMKRSAEIRKNMIDINEN